MPLSRESLRLLKAIIDQGHKLEKLWPSDSSETSSEQPRLKPIDELKKLVELIRSTSLSEDHDLSRLSFHAEHLVPAMTARHLATILVPFERLHGKALRDDEFMIASEDRAPQERRIAPFVVVADNLRSSFNVGAILRTAECFGAEEVVMTGYTPTPDDEKTARTSLGTQDVIAWRREEKLSSAITDLKARGYEVVAFETVEGAIALPDFQWPAKPALLLGNERFGVDHEALAQAEHIVRIPMYGAKNSLNVGIACGVALADWRAKLASGGKKVDLAATATAPRTTDSKAPDSESQTSCIVSLESRSSNPVVHEPPPTFAPIGVFRTQAVHPYEARRQATEDQSGLEGYVELESGRGFEQALKDLEGFSKVWLIYRFHHNENWKPMVMPPRGPREKRGVFATRSPYRPNAIGLSAVDLVKVDGLKITVRGHDLLDGSPILDIKPYLPYADAFPTAKAGWTDSLANEKYEVTFSNLASNQLKWLEDAGVSQIREFLRAQLEFDPLDDERKRISQTKDSYVLAYRTWRATFNLNQRSIEVLEISSGYSSADLDSKDDKYKDKETHRRFNAALWK